MANIRIYQLPSDVGISMTDNDLYPVDKYLGVGSYTTVFKSGSNMKNYISNYVTSLSTSTFTNINTSINTTKTEIYDNFDYFASGSNSILITTGSSHLADIPLTFGPPMAVGSIVKIIVKMSAMSGGYVAMLESEIIIQTTASGTITPIAPFILSQTNKYKLGDYAQFDIQDGGSFTLVPYSGFNYNLRCTCAFSISTNVHYKYVIYTT